MAVGAEGAVLVKALDFGVVLPTTSGIVCCTCTYGKSSCAHVQRVISIIASDEEDIPDVLFPFAQAKNATKKKQMDHPPCCFSKNTISFHTTPSLAAVMQQPLTLRFNVKDSVSHLKEIESCICPKCGCNNWREVPSEKPSTIIMPRFSIHSIGKGTLQ